MEISPNRLVAICAGLFAGIVAINFVAQYRNNAEFKESLSVIDFSALRARLNREEGIAAPQADMQQEFDFDSGDAENLLVQED